MIRYHLKIDPDTLSDEEWAEHVEGLKWARQEELKHSQQLLGQKSTGG